VTAPHSLDSLNQAGSDSDSSAGAVSDSGLPSARETAQSTEQQMRTVFGELFPAADHIVEVSTLIPSLTYSVAQVFCVFVSCFS
jgi:hypothetical protein